MSRRPLRPRSRGLSTLPFPYPNLKAEDTSNAAISKAIGEVKANQKAMMDILNKLISNQYFIMGLAHSGAMANLYAVLGQHASYQPPTDVALYEQAMEQYIDLYQS